MVNNVVRVCAQSDIAPETVPDLLDSLRDAWNSRADQGVVVELDGVLAHSPENSNRDARRDNANTLDGYQTLRYSWVPVAYHACETAQQVFELLRRNGYVGTLARCGKKCRIP